MEGCGPPELSHEISIRHVGKWPLRYQVTDVLVGQILDLIQASGHTNNGPTDDDPLLLVLQLLAALLPDAPHNPDLNNLRGHLLHRVTTRREARSFLLQSRSLSLAFLDGKTPLPEQRIVSWIKHTITSQMPSGGLNADAVCAGERGRQSTAVVVALVCALRVLDAIRPNAESSGGEGGWDRTAYGPVDPDVVLAVAAEQGTGAEVTKLIERWRFDERALGQSGLLMLNVALRANNREVAEVLIKRYPRLPEVTVFEEETGMTALHALAKAGPKVTHSAATALLSLLLPFLGTQVGGIDVGIPDLGSIDEYDINKVAGVTPLMLAVDSMSIGVVQALLAAGASVHARTSLGHTALHFCTLARHRSKDPSLETYTAAAKHLLHAGAKSTAKDARGHTPITDPAAHPDLVALVRGYRSPTSHGGSGGDGARRGSGLKLGGQLQPLDLSAAFKSDDENPADEAMGGSGGRGRGLEQAAEKIQRVVMMDRSAALPRRPLSPRPDPASRSPMGSPVTSPTGATSPGGGRRSLIGSPTNRAGSPRSSSMVLNAGSPRGGAVGGCMSPGGKVGSPSHHMRKSSRSMSPGSVNPTASPQATFMRVQPDVYRVLVEGQEDESDSCVGVVMSPEAALHLPALRHHGQHAADGEALLKQQHPLARTGGRANSPQHQQASLQAAPAADCLPHIGQKSATGTIIVLDSPNSPVASDSRDRAAMDVQRVVRGGVARRKMARLRVDVGGNSSETDGTDENVLDAAPPVIGAVDGGANIGTVERSVVHEVRGAQEPPHSAWEGRGSVSEVRRASASILDAASRGVSYARRGSAAAKHAAPRLPADDLAPLSEASTDAGEAVGVERPVAVPVDKHPERYYEETFYGGAAADIQKVARRHSLAR